ncbi:hypothetical protein H6P81_017248 [Aristolochia fimbriata]|uniref:Pectinesterase catalytic domain-containing protein n=1 Tax=Aristolochia fimbriata TaxID=158543 RepID=A0AAV7DXX6_ARIFI|nr:hypothetical protein H6P81_017248 [Aristolochia fimbriata]
MQSTTRETIHNVGTVRFKEKNVGIVIAVIAVLISAVALTLAFTVFKPKCPGPKIKPSVVVALDGSGDFTTVSAAVAAAPSHSRKYFGIFIRPGVYHEQVRVPAEKTRLAFLGSGIGVTVIFSNRSWPEYSSEATATLHVKGDGFVAMDISFENAGDPAATGYTVALANDGDKTAFLRCSFKGYSGVVKAGRGLQFYGNVNIHGAVDVVWGSAAAVFQKCGMYPEKPLPDQEGSSLTFQQRSAPFERAGFVFHGCYIAAPPLGSRVFLGRPGGAYSLVVVMDSYLSGPTAGWLPESSSPSLPKTLYLGEYKNGGVQGVGPGWKNMTAVEASRFTVAGFINGDKWLPDASVEYVSNF